MTLPLRFRAGDNPPTPARTSLRIDGAAPLTPLPSSFIRAASLHFDTTHA